MKEDRNNPNLRLWCIMRRFFDKPSRIFSDLSSEENYTLITLLFKDKIGIKVPFTDGIIDTWNDFEIAATHFKNVSKYE